MSELENLRHDYQHCRATYDYEKKLYNDHLESLQVFLMVGHNVYNDGYRLHQAQLLTPQKQTVEKKYPDSDIYWKKFDKKYHFSSQFTTDLIAMNHTDFIITSAFQEIA